jgi:hypothetical protein
VRLTRPTRSIKKNSTVEDQFMNCIPRCTSVQEGYVSALLCGPSSKLFIYRFILSCFVVAS